MAEYWKQFVALATVYAHKYRDDFFVRTEVNIIILHVIYGTFILCLTIIALVILYHNTITGTIAAFQAGLTATSSAITVNTVLGPLKEGRTQEIAGVVFLILSSTVMFGFLVARYTLTPAKNALSTQKQFIGNIAHELRTPLSIIKTNIEVRLLEPDLSDAARKIHKSNLEELDRISDIINNLLSLNTLVRPEQIPFTNVDVGKVVHRAVDKLSHLSQKKPIRIRIKSAKERAAWGNPAGIEQIAVNVIKNAIQHTDSGEIVISVGPNVQGDLELATRDTGSGIKREDLFRIFEPFYRGDRARTRAGGAGSGLGLSIVNELVKLHHGRVNIQSAPGHGTNVVITLPPGHYEPRDEETPHMNEVSSDFSHRGRRSRA